MSAILMANMVIAHSLTGRLDQSMLVFYTPKIIIIFFVWLSFYCYVFTEGMYILKEHLINNGYSNPDSLALKILEVNFHISSYCNHSSK